MLTFTTPCRQGCLCVSGLKSEMRTIYGTLEYQSKGEKVTQELEITVPKDATLGRWLSIFGCVTRQTIKPKGAKYGVVKFRLDGTNKPLTIGEYIANQIHRWTLRGKQITVSHFVPIFPDPPPPPRPPRKSS